MRLFNTGKIDFEINESFLKDFVIQITTQIYFKHFSNENYQILKIKFSKLTDQVLL
jgi:hypothetical protein